MNYYVVVEGKCEKIVYKSWIPVINNRLSYADDITKITDNQFYIVSGFGYPNYFNLIKNAIEDVNYSDVFDKLVISVDSEEMSLSEKFEEISSYISKFECRATICIIVQYYCLETWALGNRVFPKRNTTDKVLRSFYNFFDVKELDPELLPSIDPANYTRAQFATKYLHCIVNNRSDRLTYTKSNPIVLTHNGYFDQLRSRLLQTSHIKSMQLFIDAFSA